MKYELIDYEFDRSGEGEFKVSINGIQYKFLFTYSVEWDDNHPAAIFDCLWRVKGEDIEEYDMNRLPPGLAQDIEEMIDNSGYEGEWAEDRMGMMIDYAHDLYTDR